MDDTQTTSLDVSIEGDASPPQESRFQLDSLKLDRKAVNIFCNVRRFEDKRAWLLIRLTPYCLLKQIDVVGTGNRHTGARQVWH